MSNTCGPTFYNHFVLCGNFCDCRCNGAMTTPLFSSKKYGMAPCHQPDPVRLPTACTWIGHAYVDRARFFQVHALVEHISSRSATCLHKTELERKRTRSILQSSFFSKERMRKRDRERVCVRASMTGESSRACFSWLQRSIAERNLPSQSSTELEQKS